jgi:hypothetical protein
LSQNISSGRFNFKGINGFNVVSRIKNDQAIIVLNLHYNGGLLMFLIPKVLPLEKADSLILSH